MRGQHMNGRGGHKYLVFSNEYGALLGVDEKVLELEKGGIAHTVNVANATESGPLKCLLLCYMTLTSVTDKLGDSGRRHR